MKSSKPSTGVFTALVLPLGPSAPLNMFWFAALPLTPLSFFLCMPLLGEFLVCTRIGIRFVFLVLNFQVLVVCFIATFIKGFEQLLSWKLLVFFIHFFTFGFTLRHGWISSSSSEASKETPLSNGVSSSSEILSKKSCIACSCCYSDKNRCFLFGGILSLYLICFHFSY